MKLRRMRVTKKGISTGMLRRLSNFPSKKRTGAIIGSVITTRKFESGEPFVFGNHESIARPNIIICNARTQETKTYESTVVNLKSSFRQTVNQELGCHAFVTA